jgi:prevent-host-death family protein
MMAQWQTADAKQQLTQVIAAAEQNGPQLVMRHKEPVAVILSPDDYRKLVRQANANFGHLLSESPFEPDDVKGFDMSLRNAG